MRFVKKALIMMLCVCLAASVFSSCSKSEKMIDFIYPFEGNVNSYDPQVAATSDEYLIIENTFEGLIRMDDDGTIHPGCAESWKVSNDGLTYTFNIQKGLKWDIRTDKYKEGEHKGEFRDSRLQMLGYEFNPDITAKDFVFALQRAVKPETKCPLFSSVSSIVNAVEINSGKLKASALGARAVSTYILEIKLRSPDESFMQSLTGAAAMPCNEEFFNATKGRYGLSTKYTLFNGQFYVNQILESSYLLKQNKDYKGPSPTKASELTLKIPDEDESKKTVERLTSGYYDAAYITSAQSEQIKESSNITFTPYNDTTLAFVFNTNNEVFQSKTMRQAFCLGFSRDNTGDKSYLSPAKNLVPSSVKIDANNASKAMGVTIREQNNEKSISLFKKGIEIIDTEDLTVTVITTPQYEETVKFLLQGIQSGIGAQTKNKSGETITFTLKVKALDEAELKTAVAKGEYDIVFTPFKATNDSAISFLSNNFEGKSGFDNKKFTSALQNAEKAGTLSKKAQYVKQAEKVVIESYSICPMLWETSCFAQAKGVSGVQFHAGTGRVSFVNAARD
jgi:oligopeptide transport system substrate-binding protein